MSHLSSPVVVHDSPPGDAVAVYPVTGDPPSESGTRHDTTADVLPGTAATSRGADGTPAATDTCSVENADSAFPFAVAVIQCRDEGYTSAGVPETTPVRGSMLKPAGNGGYITNRGTSVKFSNLNVDVGVTGTPTTPDNTCDAGEIAGGGGTG
jgi:hypothetical protein